MDTKERLKVFGRLEEPTLIPVDKWEVTKKSMVGMIQMSNVAIAISITKNPWNGQPIVSMGGSMLTPEFEELVHKAIAGFMVDLRQQHSKIISRELTETEE
jgi:hypothetical protein